MLNCMGKIVEKVLEIDRMRFSVRKIEIVVNGYKRVGGWMEGYLL